MNSEVVGELIGSEIQLIADYGDRNLLKRVSTEAGEDENFHCGGGAIGS